MDSNEKWYSVKEVSARLSVSCDSVRRWIKRGQLRALRLPSEAPKRAEPKRVFICYRISESEMRRFERVQMTA